MNGEGSNKDLRDEKLKKKKLHSKYLGVEENILYWVFRSRKGVY
jgi:hypothetical protein